MSDSQEPFAIIFDLDGVIVDSSAFHEGSWNIWAKEYEVTLPEGFFKKTFGMRNVNIIPTYLFPHATQEESWRMSNRKEEIFRELCAGKIVLLPGVHALVLAAHKRGVPMAVASSTERKNIDLILQATGINQYFQAILASEDVQRGKPEPDVFLAAAERLSYSPSKCVVVEDAIVGIEAAKKAGMACLGVATTHPAAYLGQADRVVTRLTEITIDDLSQLIYNVETLKA